MLTNYISYEMLAAVVIILHLKSSSIAAGFVQRKKKCLLGQFSFWRQGVYTVTFGPIKKPGMNFCGNKILLKRFSALALH